MVSDTLYVTQVDSFAVYGEQYFTGMHDAINMYRDIISSMFWVFAITVAIFGLLKFFDSKKITRLDNKYNQLKVDNENLKKEILNEIENLREETKNYTQDISSYNVFYERFLELMFRKVDESEITYTIHCILVYFECAGETKRKEIEKLIPEFIGFIITDFLPKCDMKKHEESEKFLLPRIEMIKNKYNTLDINMKFEELLLVFKVNNNI